MSFTDYIENIFTQLESIPDNLTKIAEYTMFIENNGYDPDLQTITATKCDVVSAYFRRRFIIATIMCVSNIQFSSSTDAINTLQGVSKFVNAEITYSFDNDEDDVGYIFTRMLGQLTSYISNISADLPNITTVNFKTSLPACVIAYQYYQDSTRDTEIISRNNPVIGSAMQTTLELLQY